MRREVAGNSPPLSHRACVPVIGDGGVLWSQSGRENTLARENAPTCSPRCSRRSLLSQSPTAMQSKNANSTLHWEVARQVQAARKQPLRLLERPVAGAVC